MSLTYSHDHLGSFWYHSEPSLKFPQFSIKINVFVLRLNIGSLRRSKIVYVPGEGMGLKSASDNKLATDLLFLEPSLSSVSILTSSFLFTVFTFLPNDV